MVKTLDLLRDWGPLRERQQLELEKLRYEARVLAMKQRMAEQELPEEELERTMADRGGVSHRSLLPCRTPRLPTWS